ncbi:MAG: 50S ribosomal protein L22 [Acholeplasmatales bacterium]|nr:MAG: 50S ribosomal protein L22 [Acholeplasmatales bacterium]
MEARSQAKMVRISSRKVKLVIDLIRGKQVGEALAILRLTPKAASPMVEKLLRSAVANAEHNYNMDTENLYVKEVYVGEGPTLKRIRPRAKGSASRIYKRTSHTTIVVAEKE